MHEMSIAIEIVRQSLDFAARHHATRIDEVEVEVGRLRQVVPEALDLAFTAACEETIAAGAKLKITEKDVVAVCRNCEQRFTPELDNFLCGKCGQADVRVVEGNDIILKTLVCQAPEEETVP